MPKGIFCTLHALIDASDHVIVLTPCYQSLLEIPKNIGADITEIPLKEEKDWRIDLDAIASAIKPNKNVLSLIFLTILRVKLLSQMR